MRSATARKINYETDEARLENFTVTVDGLPVFNGESFEQHVRDFQEIEAPKSQLQWAQAAIAASLISKHGENTVDTFAYEVHRSGRYIRGLAQTYRAFKKGNRIAHLSFRHHYLAAEANNPIRAIQVANDREMSTRELERWVRLQAAKPSGRVAKKLALVKTEDRDEQSTVAEPEEFEDEEIARGDADVIVADGVKILTALDYLRQIVDSPYLKSRYLNELADEIAWEINMATKGPERKTDRIFAFIQGGCYRAQELADKSTLSLHETKRALDTLISQGKVVEDKQYKGEIASGITNTLYRPRDLSYQDNYKPEVEYAPSRKSDAA